MTNHSILAVAALLLGTLAAPAEIVLLGRVELPGTERDRSGLEGLQRDGTPLDRLGGLGSGIAYTGRGDVYLMVSDRGPADGANEFPCRLHALEITVALKPKPAVAARLLTTTLLTTADGRRLSGSLDAFDPDKPRQSLRFDPEGIRVGPRGQWFIADEYGPKVCEFDGKGRLIREIPIPDYYSPGMPGKLPPDELPPRNHAGRQPNRGFEGLAISPKGDRLLAAMQGPLLQDGALDADNKRIGTLCRLLEIELASGRHREFLYQLESPDNGISEILSVNENELLVLERDGRAGKEAKSKQIFLIDLRGADDVGGRPALPDDLRRSVRAVKKRLFLDLLDPAFGIGGDDCPEKFEGLTFGPELPDGRRLLLVTVDNDFLADRPTTILAFACDAKDLPNWKPQELSLPSKGPSGR